MADPQSRRRPWWRIVLAVLLAVVVIVLLFTVVFPQVERYLENPTLGLGDRVHAVVSSP